MINQASALSVERWRQLSHAKARETDREVIADHPTEPARRRRLTLDPGRAAHYGPVTRHRAAGAPIPASSPTWPTCRRAQPFDPDDIDAAQRPADRLGSLPLAPLRGGRGDRARTAACRSPSASRTAGRAPSASAARSRRSTASASRPSGCTATSSAAPSSCASTPASTGSAARCNPDDYDYNLGVTFTRPGRLRRRTPTSSPRSSASGSTSTPTASARSPAAAGFSRTFGDRLTGEHLRRGLARPLRGRLRHPPLHDLRRWSGAAPYDRRDDPLDATPRLLPRRRRVEPFYEAEYGNPAVRRHARGPRLPRLRRGAPGRARRPRASSAASSAPPSRKARPTCCSSPAAAARSAAIAYRSIGVETVEPDGEDRDLRRRRRAACSRPRPRCATGSASATARRLRRHRPRHRGLRRSPASTRLPHRRRRSACATTPASAILRVDLATPLNPRRATTRPSRSTSASDRRFEAASRQSSACSCSWRSPRWPRTRPTTERQRLPHQPAREPALGARPADPAERRLRRALVAGADPAHHHLRRAGRLARDRQRRARLEPARAAARPGQRQPAERRAHRLAAPRRAAAGPRRRAAAGRGQALRPARAAGLDPARASSASRAISFDERGLRPGGGALARRAR